MRFEARSVLMSSLMAFVPISAAQLESNFFVVTSLNATLPGNATATPATFRFNLVDPSPSSNASTTCGALWYANGSYPTLWTRCADPAYSWYLSSFTDLSAFTLEAQYSFTSPSLGPPPEDGETQFARGTFGAANITCRGRGGRTCTLARGTEAQLKIYAIVA